MTALTGTLEGNNPLELVFQNKQLLSKHKWNAPRNKKPHKTNQKLNIFSLPGLNPSWPQHWKCFAGSRIDVIWARIVLWAYLRPIFRHFYTSGLFGFQIHIWRTILLLRFHHSTEKKLKTIEPHWFFFLFEVNLCLSIHKVQYYKLPFTAGKMVWKIKKIEKKHLELHRLNVIFIKNQVFTAANLISIFQTDRNKFPALKPQGVSLKNYRSSLTRIHRNPLV